MIKKYGKIIIPGDVSIWPHELRVAKILASVGFVVEFLPTRNHKTADVLVDGVEYEIKSPETCRLSSIEQLLRKALKQSPNIIIDTFRCRIQEERLCGYLIYKCRNQKQIKRMLFIARSGEIVDIKKLV